MLIAGSEAGGSRRDRRINSAFIAAQRAQAALNENAPMAGPIIVQYPPKPLKIHVPDTYEKQRKKLKAFLY